jgi:NAD-dependent dihydropyrimidine dehydrogenase PreA subunit
LISSIKQVPSIRLGRNLRLQKICLALPQHRFYKKPCAFKRVPIARDFRSKWFVKYNHEGHPVWQTDNPKDGSIHGHIVGVHIESCVGCMKCVKACPTNVFVPWFDEHQREVVDPIRELDCIICLICELVCPTDAISISREGGSLDTLDSLLKDATEY